MALQSTSFIMTVLLILEASIAVYIIPKSSRKQLTASLTNITTPRLFYIEPNGLTYYKPSFDNNQTYLYHLFSMESWDTYPPPAYTHSFVQVDIFDVNFNPINDDTPFTLDIRTEDQLNGDNVCKNPITNDILTCWFTVTHNWGDRISCNIFFVKSETYSESVFLTPVDYTYGNYGIACFDDGYLIPYVIGSASNSDPISLKAAILDLNGNIVSNQLIKDLSITHSVGSYSSFGGLHFNATYVNQSASGLFVINIPLGTGLIESVYGYYANASIHIYKDEEINVNDDITLFLSDTIDFTEDCCYISLYAKGWHSPYNIFGRITDIYGNRINNDTDVLLINNVTANGNDYYYSQFIDLPMLSNDNDTIRYFAILYYNDIGGEDAKFVSMDVYYIVKNDTEYNVIRVGTYKTVEGINYKKEGKVYMDLMNVYNIPGSNDIHIIYRQEIEIKVNTSYWHYYDIYGQIFAVSFTNAPSQAPTTAIPTTEPTTTVTDQGSSANATIPILTGLGILILLLLIGGIVFFVYYKKRMKNNVDHTFLSMNETVN